MQIEFQFTGETTATITTEQWRIIPDFPRYEASTMGRIRNRHTGRYMALKMAHDGYLHIGLIKDGKQREKLVHRIIAETWLESSEPDQIIVNHKNYQRHDNRVSNLEWCNRSHNAKHAHSKSK